MNVFIENSGVQALATAIRWDEQETRSDEKFFSPRSVPEHTRVHPMLHWKERDVWDFINMKISPSVHFTQKDIDLWAPNALPEELQSSPPGNRILKNLGTGRSKSKQRRDHSDIARPGLYVNFRP